MDKIFESYSELMSMARGEVRATVISAEELSSAQLSQVCFAFLSSVV